MPPTMPTVSALEATSSVLFLVRPTAAPAALRIAISSVAMPMATSQPKQALPQCRPPNSSRWRSSADCRRSLPARPKRLFSVTERLPALDVLAMFEPSSRNGTRPFAARYLCARSRAAFCLDGGARRSLAPPHASVAGVVDVDALGAHGLRDRLFAGLDVLFQANAFLGDGALVRHDFLLVEHDLVLLLGERGAVERVVDVGVGDRLALDADLLAADRDGLG